MSPTLCIPLAPATRYAQFQGGPLHGEEYPVLEHPTWLWFEERREPDLTDITARGPWLPLLYPRRFHRYELFGGCYQHTRAEEESITVFIGDAWFSREKPRVRRIGAGPRG